MKMTPKNKKHDRLMGNVTHPEECSLLCVSISQDDGQYLLLKKM